MNAPAKITASLDAETVALVDRLAGAKGMSGAEYAAEAIRRVAESDADYAAFIQVGLDQLDRGEGIPHEQVMAELEAMIERRRAQCG